jgi:hypothetical protein
MPAVFEGVISDRSRSRNGMGSVVGVVSRSCDSLTRPRRVFWGTLECTEKSSGAGDRRDTRGEVV